MRTRTGRSTWVLGAVLAVAACGGAVEHRGDEALQVQLRISPTPPMVGAAGVAVSATDDDVALGPPTRVEVAVRGESGPTTVLAFEDGVWVGTLEFPRPGEVRVDVSIETSDGRTATSGIPVRVVRRP